MNASESSAEQRNDPAIKVALKILRYLEENPDSADTLEGIAGWWLLKQSVSDTEKLVKLALETLVKKDLIIAIDAADSRRHYHLNPDRIEETRRLIGESESSWLATLASDL